MEGARRFEMSMNGGMSLSRRVRSSRPIPRRGQVLLMAFAGSYNHSIIQNSFGNSLSCCFGFESLSLDLAPGGVGYVFIEWLQHADVKDGMELAAPPMRRINFLMALGDFPALGTFTVWGSNGCYPFTISKALFPVEELLRELKHSWATSSSLTQFFCVALTKWQRYSSNMELNRSV
ncbi:hypothetical protein RJ639_038593 [Escallonia herrerae]|uniref:Uncharacterized protein n=1 Tax=Escallonia herrerae TaxID=1293975 RepID=A0AA88WMP5_9ASTE|nr:hypothetical protein RJ639_038593 [Escallonia herrerae]